MDLARFPEPPATGSTLPLVWGGDEDTPGWVISATVHAARMTAEGVVLDLEIPVVVKQWGRGTWRHWNIDKGWTSGDGRLG